MDRRRFLLGLVTLSAPVCGVLRSAEARSPILGCRLTTGNDSERPFRLMASTRDAGAFNADNYDDRLRRLVKVLVNDFGVEPGFSFYDDGDGANALATPARLTENAGPDGTVLIGAHLLVSEGKRSCEGALRPNPKPNEGLWDMQRLDECRWTRVVVEDFIMAHEFAHILQYKKGMKPDGPWQMELHADFLAGWRLGWDQFKDEHGLVREETEKRPGIDFTWQHVSPWREFREAGRVLNRSSEPNDQVYGRLVKDAAATAFRYGDTRFSDPDHHGTPEQRQSMTALGYLAGRTGVEIGEAFERGRVVAGLK